MWALTLCGLSYGGSLVLYNGSPLYHDPLVTLRLVEKRKYLVLVAKQQPESANLIPVSRVKERGGKEGRGCGSERARGRRRMS